MKKIKQPWALTKASYSFTITEDRIFRRVISEMQNYMTFENKTDLDSDFEAVLSVRDFLPEEKSTNHLTVAKALKRLRENTITFYKEETDEFVFTGIIMEAIYSKNRQKVKLRISKHLMPYFLYLNKGFTQYSLEVAKSCRSPYTVRLYEYLCHMVNGAKPIYETYLMVSSLKKRLQIVDRYSRAIFIKNFILEPAIKDLKKKSDIWFSIKEPIKEGRKVIGWKIQIHKKKEETQQLSLGKEDQESKRREAIFIEQERKNLLALAERFKNKTK